MKELQVQFAGGQFLGIPIENEKDVKGVKDALIDKKSIVTENDSEFYFVPHESILWAKIHDRPKTGTN